MGDDDWQRSHFRSGTQTGPERSRSRIFPGAALILALAVGGLGVSEWQGLTDLGPRRWLSSLRAAPEPDSEPRSPTAATEAAPGSDHAPRLRQLAALIAQQERGIDLMRREDDEAARRESAAHQDSATAAARVAAIENHIATTRLTARQLADARSSLSAATADLNNARRRAREAGEKRQSLAARMTKASVLRDDARRESELLSTPRPDIVPAVIAP